jgi:hypothetical protein
MSVPNPCASHYRDFLGSLAVKPCRKGIAQ